MSLISYQSEALADCLDEMKAFLLQAHWEELALDKDKVPLDPNYDEYLKLDELKRLIVITVRDRGTMIGYFLGFVGPALHYKSCFECAMDIFYIKPEYRKQGVGKGLFNYVEFTLKKMGVQRWIVGSKLHKDSAFLFEQLNFKPIEMYYSKYIGD
jgi:GNAT superfamily N-acetyltransferase